MISNETKVLIDDIRTSRNASKHSSTRPSISHRADDEHSEISDDPLRDIDEKHSALQFRVNADMNNHEHDTRSAQLRFYDGTGINSCARDASGFPAPEPISDECMANCISRYRKRTDPNHDLLGCASCGIFLIDDDATLKPVPLAQVAVLRMTTEV